MNEGNVVRQVFRAIEERDRERLFSLLDPEVELCDSPSLPYGGTFRGRDALRERLERAPHDTWLGSWGPLQPTEADRRMDPRIVAANGHEVVVLYRQRAVDPSGERLDAPVLGLYEVRDGRLARAQMFYFDTVAVAGFLARANERLAQAT
jgi:ketosteroid isomerase-like protein